MDERRDPCGNSDLLFRCLHIPGSKEEMPLVTSASNTWTLASFPVGSLHFCRLYLKKVRPSVVQVFTEPDMWVPKLGSRVGTPKI